MKTMRWQSRNIEPCKFRPQSRKVGIPTDSLPRELPLRGFNFWACSSTVDQDDTQSGRNPEVVATVHKVRLLATSTNLMSLSTDREASIKAGVGCEKHPTVMVPSHVKALCAAAIRSLLKKPLALLGTWASPIHFPRVRSNVVNEVNKPWRGIRPETSSVAGALASGITCRASLNECPVATDAIMGCKQGPQSMVVRLHPGLPILSVAVNPEVM